MGLFWDHFGDLKKNIYCKIALVGATVHFIFWASEKGKSWCLWFVFVLCSRPARRLLGLRDSLLVFDQHRP